MDQTNYYRSVSLPPSLRILRIYSIHYFEYASDFSFPGESHAFWEFLCVDKGWVLVTARDRQLRLEKNQIIFHEPNEFHALRADGQTAPNLIVVSFACDSRAMNFFRSRIFTVDETERQLLAALIREARLLFSSPLNDPLLPCLEKAPDPPFGSAQMVQLLLTQFLIRLQRRYTLPPEKPAGVSTVSKNERLYGHILLYLNQRVREPLTVPQICHDNLISSSCLQRLFRQHHGCGVMCYFGDLKIEEAKRLIRSRSMNITQIAYWLGYSSIHYFSRQFTRRTGMTPSQYAASIKSLSDTYRPEA
ncbi:MAG: AraC family transcriptional regulator [Eubacteriales bacterium]|nr:AraC family transcriptional regulator [Eubacteriales bacterium]